MLSGTGPGRNMGQTIAIPPSTIERRALVAIVALGLLMPNTSAKHSKRVKAIGAGAKRGPADASVGRRKAVADNMKGLRDLDDPGVISFDALRALGQPKADETVAA